MCLVTFLIHGHLFAFKAKRKKEKEKEREIQRYDFWFLARFFSRSSRFRARFIARTWEISGLAACKAWLIKVYGQIVECKRVPRSCGRKLHPYFTRGYSRNNRVLCNRLQITVVWYPCDELRALFVRASLPPPFLPFVSSLSRSNPSLTLRVVPNHSPCIAILWQKRAFDGVGRVWWSLINQRSQRRQRRVSFFLSFSLFSFERKDKEMKHCWQSW